MSEGQKKRVYLVGVLDYTQVILGAMTLIGVVANGAIAAWVTIQLRTPSGDTIGRVSERTHDMAAANSLALTEMHEHGHVERERDDTA